ncbi:MAG: GNAT family N-acetyltransferase [Oscillospiraceae bacterium]|jgi:hypothetical protein
MAVRLITDKNLWDGFIDSSPYGLVFHKWDFLKLAEKHTGYKLLPYGIYKGEQLVCVFPLFYKKILGVRQLFSPPPKSGIPYLGPVLQESYDNAKQVKKESIINSIVLEIDAEINKLAPNYFSAVLVPGLLDIRPFQWLGYSVEPGYTYTCSLAPDLNAIWKGFSTVCRQNIRKGEALNCTLETSGDVSGITGRLTERYSEQGLNLTLSADYLSEVLKAYPDNFKLNCLLDNGKLVGSVLIQAYKRYIAWIGLSKMKDKKYVYANEFMIWQLMRQAKAQGFKRFEISGANKYSLCKFRSKFNPRLDMYFTVSKKDVLGKTAEAFYYRFVKRK